MQTNVRNSAATARVRVLLAGPRPPPIRGATTLTINADVIAKARLRGELGNPPGKGGSMGDAVNWELLLDYQPTDHLFFVTDDSDFYSPLDEGRPLEFLTADGRASSAHPSTSCAASRSFRTKSPMRSCRLRMTRRTSVTSSSNACSIAGASPRHIT